MAGKNSVLTNDKVFFGIVKNLFAEMARGKLILLQDSGDGEEALQHEILETDELGNMCVKNAAKVLGPSLSRLSGPAAGG